jgi:hypothetical protein
MERESLSPPKLIDGPADRQALEPCRPVSDVVPARHFHGRQKDILKALIGVSAVAQDAVKRFPNGWAVGSDYGVPINHRLKG